jgi:hypothetical protein
MIRTLSVVIAVAVLIASSVAQISSNKSAPSWEVRVDALDSSGGTVYVTNCGDDHLCAGQTYSLTTADAGIKAELKNFHVGDHLSGVRVDDKGQILSVAGLDAWAVSTKTRVLTLTAVAALLLGFASLATHFAPQRFIIGADNRYSNSKFQVALWFWLLLTTYLSAIFLRVLGPGWNFFGSVNIPQNLVILSGLSALTYGGAKAITTAKVNASTAAGVVDAKPRAPAPNFFADLVQNDGTPAAAAGGGVSALNTAVRSFDFGDFQMLVVTVVAVVIYLLTAYHFLGQIQFAASVSLPDVDTTLLSTFGLGQGAYLVKKAAGNVGTT